MFKYPHDTINNKNNKNMFKTFPIRMKLISRVQFKMLKK